MKPKTGKTKTYVYATKIIHECGCGLCGRIFTSALALRLHNKAAHVGEEKLKCKNGCGFCKREFETTKQQLEHTKFCNSKIRRGRR